MKGHCVLHALKFKVIVAALLLVFGAVVMFLWNHLMPDLFAMHAIGYWQAVGLLLLTRILFGGFRGGGPHMFWRHRMHERLAQMTPEEREKFFAGVQKGCDC